MRLIKLERLAAAAAASLAVSTCFAQAVIIAPTAPPAPRVEVVPAPRSGYVWDQGRWRWAHGRYVWVPGHWQAVRPGHHWVPGHWVHGRRGWRWMEGHWARR
jgi:hypothetical protein